MEVQILFIFLVKVQVIIMLLLFIIYILYEITKIRCFFIQGNLG